MPQRRQRSTSPSEVILLARPKKPVVFRAEVKEGIVILRGEDGSVAVVPEEEVCGLVERLNLIVEGFSCGKRAG
ncbi:hypothetical protein CF15_05710 [Pyrodictium occultum]|uniref:Uncharacterized protein n=1 Tax=Pyrodictium occultum TaxID=2309 RepID=A0A0V8RW54_PYROC|nr:hypothetical protein [Pyrodictium occultum]KSW12248.1 hypothetical protein CF15_05710 [Pyrodictium occultum]